MDEATPDEGGTYQLARFVITFCYLAGGKMYKGKYSAGSPKEIGETFAIDFNPNKPQENTGSDETRSLTLKVAVGAVGIAIAILLIRLFPDINR